MSKLKFLLPAAIVIGMFFVSCKKTTTNTTVVADSVMYSAWIPLSLTATTPASDSDYEQDISAPNLTQTILNSGAVNVYGNYSGSGGTFISLVQDYQLYPTFAVGNIYLDAFGTYGYSGVYNYIDSVRYVIIPAKVAVTGSDGTTHTYTAQQLKLMDYGTLTKTLSIPAKGASFTNN